MADSNSFCIMKLIALSTIFAKLAYADLDSILGQFATMLKANNASIEGEVGARLRSLSSLNDNREFVDPILSQMDPIRNYGCWCHFGAEWVHAGGQVQDSIDARCKQLINGYRCAKMDGNDRGEDCDAGNIAYTTYNYFGGEPIVSNCQASNPGNICAQDACVIEGQFTLDFLVDFVSGNIANTVDVQFQGAPNGVWDRDASCLTAQNNQPQDRACCGAQPNRAPYSITVGTHDCCNGLNLFNLATHQCCMPAGTVEPVGTTCP